MPTTQTRPATRGRSAFAERPQQADDTRRLKSSDRVLIEQATRGFDVLQGKWKVHLIVALARGVRRRSRLHACLPGISKKVMTDCLRNLERDGLVTRRIYAQVPARVEYDLTPLGWAITDVIVALSDWTDRHTADVARARNEYWLRRAETDDILQAGHAA
jgi:DNA-binding HxlR family transcriptional regulator